MSNASLEYKFQEIMGQTDLMENGNLICIHIPGIDSE